MPLPPSADSGARRNPRQKRAQNTVAAIFEATALLANESADRALSTNLIAERAGVSIGTLYQYFPSWQAIVEAIAKQERMQVMRQLDELLAKVGQPGTSPHDGLRQFVHVYVSAFAGTSSQRAVFKLAWQNDHLESSVQSLREAAERVALHLQRLSHPTLRAASPAQAFVLTRALMGTVRAAVLEGSPVLDSAAFEDELVRMCWALLVADASA